jgi:hypothetical protein
MQFPVSSFQFPVACCLFSPFFRGRARLYRLLKNSVGTCFEGRGFSRAIKVLHLCHSEGLQPRGILVLLKRREFLLRWKLATGNFVRGFFK